MGLGERLAHAWNAFTGAKADVQGTFAPEISAHSGWVPGVKQSAGPSAFMADRNMIENVITRMSIDVSSIDFVHAEIDDNEHFMGVKESGLQECLSVEANIDQSSRYFMQDLVLTMLTDGVACVVPVDTTINPNSSGGYDIRSMRVGRITTWHPKHVRVEVYNENKGIREEVTMSKGSVAIIVNPLYGIMNEPNSTFQRLMRKLALLDTVDNDLVNKKLDLIIQAPYVLKSPARQKMAEPK